MKKISYKYLLLLLLGLSNQSIFAYNKVIFQQQVKNIEDICGGKLKNKPELLFTPEKDVRAILLKNNKDLRYKDLFPNVPKVFFLKEDNTIYYTKNFAGNYALNIKEIPIFCQILLFHELVH